MISPPELYGSLYLYSLRFFAGGVWLWLLQVEAVEAAGADTIPRAASPALFWGPKHLLFQETKPGSPPQA